MRLTCRLLMSEFVTHDVKRFVLSKPRSFTWIPGQGALVSINEPGYADQDSPFTPTSLPEDSVLEFTIKRYPGRHGVTDRLHQLQPGTELLLTRVFGDIAYKGPGTFIAGGAGITPFVGILRQCARQGKLKGNRLIFSNKRWEDVIYERELRSYLGKDSHFVLTEERRPGYESRRVDARLLKSVLKGFKDYFYLCGPPKFIFDIKDTLLHLGANDKKIIYDEP